MDANFINLTEENLASEHLCCIIRSKKPHAGVEAKREWLAERLKEGHVFRKLDAKATAFIEYAPLENAWVPIEGENYLYIYCLWTLGETRGKGYGRALMEYCLDDARAKGRSGVCMLGAKRQKAWLTDQSFAARFGFAPVDETDNGYALLARSFDGTAPRFCESARRMRIDEQALTIYYDRQCPYVRTAIDAAKKVCAEQGAPLILREVRTLAEAKALPCAFNNWAVFFKGEFQTVNLTVDPASIRRILKK